MSWLSTVATTLDFIAEVFREQRTQRPVDQAAHERLVLSLGRPSRLKKPPGMLAGCDRPFR